MTIIDALSTDAILTLAPVSTSPLAVMTAMPVQPTHATRSPDVATHELLVTTMMLAPPTRVFRTGVVTILPLSVMTAMPAQPTHATRPVDVSTLPRSAMTTTTAPSTVAIRRLGNVSLPL
jgi:hypothetical protein